MRSEQYEELCRFFLSQKFGVPVDEIKSGSIPNARRLDQPEFQHQIDLHWETGTDLTLYFHIANAKWRSTDKVDQPEVLLLKQVKQDVGAHKAVMITSTGFTAGDSTARRGLTGFRFQPRAVTQPFTLVRRSIVGLSFVNEMIQ